jgi:hypothetical protein
MTPTVLLDAAIVFSAAASLSFVVIYGWSSKWWHNLIGRGLMVKSIMQTWIFVGLAIGHFFISPDVGTSGYPVAPSIALFALFGIADAQRSVSFLVEYSRQRKIAATRAALEHNAESDVSLRTGGRTRIF